MSTSDAGILSRAELGLPELDAFGDPVAGSPDLPSTPPVNRNGACWEHFATGGACAGDPNQPCQPYINCMRALHPGGASPPDQDYWKRFVRRDPTPGTNGPTGGVLAQGCPPPAGATPVPAKSDTDKKNDVRQIMESMGASEECKSAFNNQVKNDFVKTDTVLAACATPIGNIGPEARIATTDSAQDIRNAMESSGCVEVMMAVNKQVISDVSMTCELNNTSQQTDISTRSDLAVTVRTNAIDENTKALMIAAMGSAPVPPSNNGFRYTGPNGIKMLRIAGEIYDRAAAHYTRMMGMINGTAVIRGSSFRVRNGVNIKSVSTLQSQSSAKIQEEMEATIRAQAESDIQREVGFGSTDSANVRQLVQNAIESNRSAIATMVNNVTTNTRIDTSTNGQITLNMPPTFTIEATTFDADSEIDIVSESLMASARDFGKTISMSILAEAAASGSYSSKSNGIEAALQAIGEANLALSEANKPYNDGGSFGGIIVFVIIGAAIFFILPKLIPGGGSPVMIIGITVAVYFVVALIFGFWPFNSSSEDKRVHVPMNVPSLDQSFGKSYSNAEYSRKNNGNNVLASPRFYDTPYNKRNVNSRERVYRQR